MTLTEFLLARIAEDEAVVYAARRPLYGPDKFRLAECKAKRRIVEDHADDVGWLAVDSEPDAGVIGRMRAMETACKLLALPYADHPDYREEWRP